MKRERSKEVFMILAIVVIYTIFGVLALNFITGGKPLPKLPGEMEELG